MPTLSETFEKRVFNQDYKEVAEQRNAIIDSMRVDIEKINAALEAVNSGVRFKFATGRSSSVMGYELRYESGFVHNSGVKCSSRMMYIDFPVRSPEIIIAKDDWGEFPNYKNDPDEVLSVFTLDAAQAAKDIMVDDMVRALPEKDRCELKIHFAVKRRDQQAGQDAAPK